MRPYGRFSASTTVAPILLLAVLALICHDCLGRSRSKNDSLLAKHPEVDLNFDQETEMTVSPLNPPRILTVLTTYNARTEFIQAYREVAADRRDGLEPLIFVASDEEDMDQEGVIDYKFGTPRHHRLLAAIREASSRYEDQFDWIAAGDDDTVFMYRRAMALLRHIDPTQPIAIGMVHGFCKQSNGRIRGQCDCFSPEEKRNASSQNVMDGCCLDFTHPCEVSKRPEHGINDKSMTEFLRKRMGAYDGNLYWPYGGTGFLLSAGLVARIQGSGNGWERCRELFEGVNTDIQVAKCLVAHGFTISDFHEGFYRPLTAVPEEIQDYLASNCQVIGVHAGIRHLIDEEYTIDRFKITLSAVWAEDDAEWTADDVLQNTCPPAWDALSLWE